MQHTLRTAVAAAATKSEQMQIVRALCRANIDLCCMTADGHAALQALYDHRPDLLVTGTQLPVMDVASLAARVLGRFELPVRPAVLILFRSEYLLPERDNLASMGAFFLEASAQSGAFCDALNAIVQRGRVFADHHLQTAQRLLDELGFPNHIGRSCLKNAALFCAADERLLHRMGSGLFAEVGKTCGLNAAQVERSIRHAIDLAWQSDRFDNQYRIFSDTIDAGRGHPTLSEMISRLADILRLEG